MSKYIYLETKKKRKPIVFDEILHERNVELGLDPYCHECISHPKSIDGYPTFKRNGKSQRIHRYLFCNLTGETPEVVMHLCDNPSCINTNHLKGGTQQENNRDRFLKGRNSDKKGSKNVKAKVTELDVLKIRELSRSGHKDADISKMFNIAKNTVNDIRLKKHGNTLADGL